VSGVDRLRAGYRRFAEREAAGRSALYVELAAGVAEDGEVPRRLAGLPVGKRQPNLLFAAASVAGGTPDGYGAFRALLRERLDDVEALVLARRTQTHEPARGATLPPLLAALPSRSRCSGSAPAPGCACCPIATRTSTTSPPAACTGSATARPCCADASPAPPRCPARSRASPGAQGSTSTPIRSRRPCSHATARRWRGPAGTEPR
jgi:hypothetical protein